MEVAVKTLALLPNALTCLRLFLALVILRAFISGGPAELVFWLFVVAATTDLLDGFLARVLHLVSELGARLDQWADKVLHWSVILGLYFQGFSGEKFWIPNLAILCYDLLMIFLREICRVKIPSGPFGKIKTFLLFVALGLILAPYGGGVLVEKGIALLWLAAVFAFFSFTHYVARWAWAKCK